MTPGPAVENIVWPDIDTLIDSLRPGIPVVALRRVDVEEDPRLMQVLRALRRRRHAGESVARWLVRLGVVVAALLLALAEAASDLAASALAAAALLWAALAFWRTVHALPSLLVFYEDGALLLDEIACDRHHGSVRCRRRHALPAGTVRRYRKLARLNPIWALSHVNIAVGDLRLVIARLPFRPLGRRLPRSRRAETTFFDARRRLAGLAPVDGLG